MSITGKYVVVSEDGFKEFLAKEGFPIDKQPPSTNKNILDVKVDGNKVILAHTMGDRPTRTTEYILGQEIDEKMGERSLKSTTKLEGNVLTINSKSEDGKERLKIYKFNDSGLEVVHKSKNGEGKLIYKRE